MGAEWALYGRSMGAVWALYGRCMGAIWTPYERCMGAVWALFGRCMGPVWRCMGAVWALYGRLWALYKSCNKGLYGRYNRFCMAARAVCLLYVVCLLANVSASTVVLQGSILGPLLFRTYNNDLLMVNYVFPIIMYTVYYCQALCIYFL